MEEAALLLKLAGGRLRVGDVEKALQYVLLAQEICPAVRGMPEVQQFMDSVVSKAGSAPCEEGVKCTPSEEGVKCTPLRKGLFLESTIWEPLAPSASRRH